MLSQNLKRKNSCDEKDNCQSAKKFKQLLNSRKRDQPLSDNSRDLLHEAVFQLVSLHQNTEALVKEALQWPPLCPTVDEQGQGQSLPLPPVLETLTHLESQSELSVALTMTQSCVEHLINSQKKQCSEIPSSTVKEVSTLASSIELIHTLMSEGTFHNKHFVNLVAQQPQLSLEIVWALHSEDIITISTYFSRKMSESSFVKNFSETLFESCQRKSQESLTEEQQDTRALRGVVGFLINAGFPEKKDQEQPFRKVCVAVLDAAVKRIIDSEESSLVLVPFIRWTWQKQYSLNRISFKKFCTHTLSLLMSHKPSLKVSQAFKQQAGWKSAKVSEKISDLYKQLFVPFLSKEILEVLQRILERQEVNWQTVLSFIATFLVWFEDASKLLQDHIYRLLSDGLEAGDMESTIVGFLLARQSCLEGLHVFPQYQDWFQQTFGDSSKTPASSKKSFTFLVKFLTNIVPYEAAQHLKVHILRPPHVPAKCRPLLTEYTALAKTRLADLKETCELTGGIYGDSETTGDKQMNPVESDVEKSLAAFQATGKVPSTIMEASIFRKPYFIGKYLKALLKPRHLPDKRDTRMRMIKALKKAEKIPASMYAQYEQACRNESKQLLEGVFEEDSQDDAMRDAMMAPVDQLKFRLEQLHSLVVDSWDVKKQDVPKVPEVLSLIGERLESVLKIAEETCQPSEPADPLVIDVCHPRLSSAQIELVDTVLNAICRTLTFDLRSSTPVLSWLPQLLKMTSQYKDFLRPFLQRVVWLITQEGGNLDANHICGLSALVSQISSLSAVFGTPRLYCCSQSTKLSDGSFTDSILKVLHIQGGGDIKFALRFLTSYLEYSFLNYTKFCTSSSCDGTAAMVTDNVIKLFCLLCWRLIPACRTSDVSQTSQGDGDIRTAVAVFTSEKYRQLSERFQVSVEDWAEFEINVSADEDCLPLTVRQEYYTWAMYEHFLSPDTHTADADTAGICTTLLQTLVNSQIRRSSCLAVPACNKCHRETSPRSDNSTSIMGLLQNLVVHLPPCKTRPWLAEHLESATKSENQTSNQTRAITLISLLCQLPSHLLIANKLGDIPSSDSISYTIQVIDKVLVERSSDSCYLPCLVTLHIVQGILAVTGTDVCVLKQVLLHPPVALSCLVHWQQVKGLLCLGNIRESSPLAGELFQSSAWAERCCAERNLFPSSLSSWLCGSALFAISLRGRKYSKTLSELLLSKDTNTEVVLVYMELSLLHLTRTETDTDTENSYLREGFKGVLKKYPNLIEQVLQPHLKQVVASLAARSLKNCLFLQLMTELDLGDVDVMIQNSSSLLPCVMKTFHQTCSQFELSSQAKAASLPMLAHFSNFLQRVLRRVPLTSIQFLSQIDLSDTDISLHSIVSSRLKTGR